MKSRASPSGRRTKRNVRNAERARVRFWFCVIKKKARRKAVFSSRERVSIDGSQNLSVAESDDSKCVVRCCLTSRSSVVEVDVCVCVCTSRAVLAAASKRVLRCNKVKTARNSEKAKTPYAESDTRDQKSVAATVLCFAGNSSLYCGTCHFCVTGNAYALCVHHLFPHFFHTGRALTNGAEKELLLPLVIRHLGVSLSETRDNQIFAE